MTNLRLVERNGWMTNRSSFTEVAFTARLLPDNSRVDSKGSEDTVDAVGLVVSLASETEVSRGNRHVSTRVHLAWSKGLRSAWENPFRCRSRHDQWTSDYICQTLLL